MFPVHEKNNFLSFGFGRHLMWAYFHVVWELKQKLTLLFWLDCVCSSVRSQRKCRWSSSGLPLHGCCFQPVWRRPLFRTTAECCNWECGAGRDPTRGNSQSPHCIPAVVSHLPQHLIHKGHQCFPQWSSLLRPLRKLCLCFWPSDGPSLPLSAPSFCFGLGRAYALSSIRRVQ